MDSTHRWPFDESHEACTIVSFDVLHDHMALHRVDYYCDAEWGFYSSTPQEDDFEDYESVCLRDVWRKVRGLVGLQEAVLAMRPGHCAEWDAGTWTWKIYELEQE
ncbi:hypothetical protein [Nonomuraea zeae]|uniref:hypothetical protein n=1 Tax=Nonomuraea zeae TaxID=1642303 RepID=UPI00110A9EEB|nr:hypothetical protein [Nonomuraea zeae]